MAVIDTPPETVAAASESEPAAPQTQVGGLAGVLGSGDHKVIGRLYIVFSLLFGLGIVVLGGLLSVEAVQPATLDVFDADTVFQAWTLFRIGTLFLLAFPLVIGVAMVVVPLQVGSRAIAFPRAAALSFWGWLIGSCLLVSSYLANGGPGGGRASGVDLWVSSMVLVAASILVAAVCLATTVIALRHTGMGMDRVPLYAWSVLVASVLWLLTLPVLIGMLVFTWVDLQHGGTAFGGNAAIYSHLLWLFRNPQIYVVAIPVLGFFADVLATTARARLAPRSVALGAVGAFGVLSFGAFLVTATPDDYASWVVVGIGLVAVVPVLAVLLVAGDLFRRGTLRFNTGAAYAAVALLVLLVGVLAGALGSMPRFETLGTIYDLGVNHAVVLAAIIASLGGIHWWATKVGRQPASEAIGGLAAGLLLIGSLLVVVADLVSGLAGEGGETAADWTGGIKAFNAVAAGGTGVLALGLLAALVGVLPLLRRGDDVPADPWDGQTLEWAAPSPPPLENFPEDLPPTTSAEPLLDLREED